MLSFYLIVCSLLLASAAVNDDEYGSMDGIEELDSSGNPKIDSAGQMDIEPSGQMTEDTEQVAEAEDVIAGSSYESLFDSYSQIPNAPEVASLAFPVSDLSGDNSSDLLVINFSSQAETEDFSSEILALSGADGGKLWQKEYPSTLVFAVATEDLNGNGYDDFIVSQIISDPNSSLYGGVSALEGSSGMEIWSRPQMLALTLAYPVQDMSGDDISDVLVHTIALDSMNNSISTRIARLDGTSGTTLDERIFPGVLAIEYPAGNLTSDQVQDKIIAIYQPNGSISDDIQEDLMNMTATTFMAIDGQERTTLWERNFSGLAVAMPQIDLTGDGLDELVVYLVRTGGDASISNDIAVLRGYDGELLWQKSFEGFMAVGIPGPDLTGEGQSDLIVYKLQGTEDVEVLAVKGDDGRLLWSRAGMIYIPSDILSRGFFSFLHPAL